MMPEEALAEAQRELLDYDGTGMSILEHSHRGPAYDAVHEETLALLRRLIPVPDTHEVLLLQGGATQQFAQIPMNFLPAGATADYVVFGTWGEKALAAGKSVGKTHVAATTLTEGQYRRPPRADELSLSDKPAFLHLTSNETIHGIEWHDLPVFDGVPIIVDASSNILSKPFDVSRLALVYAGAQKNIGPSGVCVVIIDKAFLARGRTDLPPFFRYATHAKEKSLVNTPPTFSIYLMRNVLRWLERQGGPTAMAALNDAKAAALYAALERHPDVYEIPVEVAARSRMNVVFRFREPAREAAFLAAAEARHLTNLAGHRSVGGLRASIYNAMPRAGVDVLCNLVDEFAGSR